MKTLTFTKWKRKLTPSGYGDNGLYVASDETVEIPVALFDDPNTVIEQTRVFVRGFDKRDPANYVMAWRISTGKRSWLVQEEPKFLLVENQLEEDGVFDEGP